MAVQLSDNRGYMTTRTTTSKDLDATNLNMGAKKGKTNEPAVKATTATNLISDELKKQYAK